MSLEGNKKQTNPPKEEVHKEKKFNPDLFNLVNKLSVNTDGDTQGLFLL